MAGSVDRDQIVRSLRDTGGFNTASLGLGAAQDIVAPPGFAEASPSQQYQYADSLVNGINTAAAKTGLGAAFTGGVGSGWRGEKNALAAHDATSDYLINNDERLGIIQRAQENQRLAQESYAGMGSVSEAWNRSDGFSNTLGNMANVVANTFGGSATSMIAPVIGGAAVGAMGGNPLSVAVGGAVGGAVEGYAAGTGRAIEERVMQDAQNGKTGTQWMDTDQAATNMTISGAIQGVADVVLAFPFLKAVKPGQLVGGQAITGAERVILNEIAAGKTGGASLEQAQALAAKLTDMAQASRLAAPTLKGAVAHGLVEAPAEYYDQAAQQVSSGAYGDLGDVMSNPDLEAQRLDAAAAGALMGSTLSTGGHVIGMPAASARNRALEQGAEMVNTANAEGRFAPDAPVADVAAPPADLSGVSMPQAGSPAPAPEVDTAPPIDPLVIDALVNRGYTEEQAIEIAQTKAANAAMATSDRGYTPEQQADLRASQANANRRTPREQLDSELEFPTAPEDRGYTPEQQADIDQGRTQRRAAQPENNSHTLRALLNRSGDLGLDPNAPQAPEGARRGVQTPIVMSPRGQQLQALVEMQQNLPGSGKKDLYTLLGNISRMVKQPPEIRAFAAELSQARTAEARAQKAQAQGARIDEGNQVVGRMAPRMQEQNAQMANAAINPIADAVRTNQEPVIQEVAAYQKGKEDIARRQPINNAAINPIVEGVRNNQLPSMQETVAYQAGREEVGRNNAVNAGNRNVARLTQAPVFGEPAAEPTVVPKRTPPKVGAAPRTTRWLDKMAQHQRDRDALQKEAETLPGLSMNAGTPASAEVVAKLKEIGFAPDAKQARLDALSNYFDQATPSNQEATTTGRKAMRPEEDTAPPQYTRAQLAGIKVRHKVILANENNTVTQGPPVDAHEALTAAEHEVNALEELLGCLRG
jgi:hypothetical protein